MNTHRLTRRSALAGAMVAGAVLYGRGRAASGDAALDFGVGTATAKPVRVDPPAAVTRWTTGSIGTSAAGRPIERWDFRPPTPERRVAVICGVHGDERASFDLASRMSQVAVPDRMHLSIIPLLNPDGWAAAERNNANDVDLNRNFSWGWSSDLFFSGQRAESELETQAAVRYLTATRPDLVIWVHQPLGYVAALAGCPPQYASLWSNVAGVTNRQGLRQAGGGETWTSTRLEVPSMLIEVGGTRTEPEGVAAHVQAFEQLLPFVEPASVWSGQS